MLAERDTAYKVPTNLPYNIPRFSAMNYNVVAQIHNTLLPGVTSTSQLDVPNYICAHHPLPNRVEPDRHSVLETGASR